MTPTKIRFSDAAAAIGTTPKSLRNWLSRGQVQLSSSQPESGWREFEVDDIRKLAVVRSLVDFGMEVREADRITGEILRHGSLGNEKPPVLPVTLPDGETIEIEDYDVVLWPSEDGVWSYTTFFRSADVEGAVALNPAVLILRVGRIIGIAFWRIKEKAAD